MALIVFTSAAGSPGVSTTALGLTMTWPRPALLVDADPTGSSTVFAGFFRGAHQPTGGLINLALAAREGSLPQAMIRETLLLDQAAKAETSAWFLPGSQGHEQVPSLMGLWEPLARQFAAFEDRGQDVLVDAGRLGLVGAPAPLIDAADLTLLVVRNSLPALAAARSWSASLRDQFAATASLTQLGVLLVDESGRWPTGAKLIPRVRPYKAREITKALGLPVVASIAWDPAAAEVYSHGASRSKKFESSALQRSLQASSAAIQSLVRTNIETLNVPVGEN